MHYVRLLGECRELLHKVTLPRPEKELFIDIRSGKYLQDQVFEIGDALARECEQLLEKDGLPDAVGGPQAHGNSKPAIVHSKGPPVPAKSPFPLF